PGTTTAVTDPGSSIPWTMVQSTISYTGNTSFAGVFGINAFNVSAVAQAAHRPRDIAVIIDMSGSMRLDSLLGQPATGAAVNAAIAQSINPETNQPTFGHYASTPHAYTAATGTFWQAPTGELAGVGNITTPTGDGPAVVGDFYGGTTAFDTSVSAFVNSVTPA